LRKSGLIIRFLRASRDTRLLTEKRQAHKRDRFLGRSEMKCDDETCADASVDSLGNMMSHSKHVLRTAATRYVPFRTGQKIGRKLCTTKPRAVVYGAWQERAESPHQQRRTRLIRASHDMEHEKWSLRFCGSRERSYR